MGDSTMQMMRNDITKVKEINIELIKSALKKLGTATKAQLADETGISVATSGKILNELCDKGEVLEAAVAAGSYGRPAKSYTYNGDYAMVASMYVATDNSSIELSAMVWNLLGEVQQSYSIEVESVTYELLHAEVQKLIKQYSRLRVVAIGIPGYIDGGVVGLCNFVDLMGLPLNGMLQEAFPDIQIIVENDMNAAAYGFYHERSGNGVDPSVAFIYSPIDPKTGLAEFIKYTKEQNDNVEVRTLMDISINFGAGFVIGGRIVRGFSGFAGEVSFLPVLRTQESDPVYASIEAVSYIISSIIPILNPEIVALTGNFFHAESLEAVREWCMRYIAPQHMPQIILRPTVHDEYMRGLRDLALEELACDVMLVTREI